MSPGAIFTRRTGAPSSSHTFLLSLLAFAISFSSSLAWKVSDVDFAAKLGSDYLARSYILTALILFVCASIIIAKLKKISPLEIFFGFQKIALALFGAISFAEALFHISEFRFVVFAFKVIGYVYSSAVVSAFWIALNPHDKRSTVTTGQCTIFTFSTYLGMATAGFLLQSSTVGASQFGPICAGCSVVCWLLGKVAYTTPTALHIETDVTTQQTASHNLLKAVCTSKAVLILVVGSVLLNVLVSSTEYSIIADFETRFMPTAGDGTGNQTIGSFVTLLGVGNIFTLFSSQVCLRFNLGRFGLSFATVLVFIILRCGFSEGHSLLISALALVVVESLYPLVVESNLSRLLAYFPESQRISARTFMESLTEPAGLILSAGLLSMSWVSVCTLGIGVVIVSFLLSLYSCSVEGKWMSYLSSFRRRGYLFATRISAFLVFCQAIIPWVEQAEEMAESLWIRHDEMEWMEPPL